MFVDGGELKHVHTALGPIHLSIAIPAERKPQSVSITAGDTHARTNEHTHIHARAHANINIQRTRMRAPTHARFHTQLPTHKQARTQVLALPYPGYDGAKRSNGTHFDEGNRGQSPMLPS